MDDNKHKADMTEAYRRAQASGNVEEIERLDAVSIKLGDKPEPDGDDVTVKTAE